MPVDGVPNFAVGQVVTAPSTATAGTTLTLKAGEGAKFSSPGNAYVGPPGTDPPAAICEIVRITGIAGDVLTIVRTQESSTNRSILVGDRVMQRATKKTFDDLNTERITTFSDAAYTALATDRIIVQVGTMSAARIVTLPSAAAVGAGYVITVVDLSGSVTPANTIGIARAGADTMPGGFGNSAFINVAYGIVRVISDGTSKWMPIVAGLTGLNLDLIAIGNLSSANDDFLQRKAGAWANRTLPQVRVDLNSEKRTAVADADYTILSTDRLVAVTSITASRTLTLPAANSVPAGYQIIVADMSGSITAAIQIAVTRAGADTIPAGLFSQIAYVNSSYGSLTMISDGTSKWTVRHNPSAVVIDGSNLVGLTDASILTTKAVKTFVDRRTTAITSGATWAPASDTTSLFVVTAQAVAATTISNPTGAPVNGQSLMMRIKDNGTARALTWSGSQWRASSDLALPTTTILSRTLYLQFIWNSTDSRWDLWRLLNNFT